jgi:uncharacterized protein YcgI (DUF1989 family)
MQHSNIDMYAVHCLSDSQVLNAFMCTGFTRDTNQYFSKPSPVRRGDYIEFLGKLQELPHYWRGEGD